MCLSNVYRISKNASDISAKELVIKNAATVKQDGSKLLFTDIMGIRTEIEASLETVDLLDNYIIVRDLV